MTVDEALKRLQERAKAWTPDDPPTWEDVAPIKIVIAYIQEKFEAAGWTTMLRS